MKQSNVLIIILNWNGVKDTIACLNSLAQMPINVDILIIDNGSRDENFIYLQKNIANRKNIILQKNNQNQGFARANNQGLKYAKENNYEYALLLNNDTLVKKDFLNLLLAAMQNRLHIALAAPKIYYINSKQIWHTGAKINKWTMKAKGLYYKNAEKPIEKNIDFLSGCCLLVRMSSLQDIGLFNEKYFAYLEDVELCQRSLKKGWELLYVPKAVIWHKVSQSTGGSAFQPIPIFLRIRNRIIYQNTYGSALQKFFFFFYSLVYVFMMMIYGLLCLKDKIFIAALKGFISGYFNNNIQLNEKFPIY